METAKQVANPGATTDTKPTFAVVETNRDALYVSLSQAAKTWHMYKGTISRHVKEGKLQWHDQPDGTRKLFAPEVANLYGPPPTGNPETVSESHRQTASSTENNAEIATLRTSLDAKEEVIKLLQQQVAAYRDQIEREREVAEQWRHEFTSMKDQVLALPAPSKQESKGFWPFKRR